MTKFLFSLDNPDYLLPHKIGILALARVLRYCDRHRHDLLVAHQITYSITARELLLCWECEDSVAFSILKNNAYYLQDGLINSPCLEMAEEETFTFSQGLLNSFLQHNTHKKLSQEKKEFSFVVESEKSVLNFSVKAVSSCYYTGGIPQLFTKKRNFVSDAQVKSNIFPGMVLDENNPEKNLESIDKFLLLFFLPIEAPVVTLPPDSLGGRKGLILIEPYDLTMQVDIKVPRSFLSLTHSSPGAALLFYCSQSHYLKHIEQLDTEVYVLGSQKWNPKQKFIKKQVVRGPITNESLGLFTTFFQQLPNSIRVVKKETTKESEDKEKVFINSSHLLGTIADNLIKNNSWYDNLGTFFLSKQYYEKHTLSMFVDKYGDVTYQQIIGLGKIAWENYLDRKNIKAQSIYYRSLRTKVCYLLKSPTNEVTFNRNLLKLFPFYFDSFHQTQLDWKIIRDYILQAIFLYNSSTSTETNDEFN